MPGFELAQLNVARLVAPLDDPRLDEFRSALARVNAEADNAPGFVWRLQTEAGDATGIQATEDPLLLVNLSVWTDVEALRAFVYGERHLELLRRRAHWFEAPTEAHLVCWWVPAGHRPPVPEAMERLALLRRIGPRPRAFTLIRPMPSPENDDVATVAGVLRSWLLEDAPSIVKMSAAELASTVGVTSGQVRAALLSLAAREPGVAVTLDDHAGDIEIRVDWERWASARHEREPQA